MIREIGKVTELSGSMAKVIVKRHSSCENCGACGMSAKPVMAFILNNEIGAKIGDKVIIEMRSKALFKAAFLVYSIPLAALIIGFLLGQSIGELRGMRPDKAEFIGIGTGFLFLCLAFFGLRRLDQSQGLGSKLQPQLVAVVGAEDSSC